MSALIGTDINAIGDFAYTGEAAWHGLGTQLQPGDTREEWQAKSGLGFTIKRAFVRYATGHCQDSAAWRIDESKVVQHRSDNGNPLGIVSPKFQTVQPTQALNFVFDVAAQHGFQPATMAPLDGGRIIFVTCTNGTISFVKDKRDTFKRYLAFTTACDGSMRTMAWYLDTRIVCRNTLRAGMSEKGGTRVTKSHRTAYDESEFAEKLGLVGENEFAKAMDELRAMARAPMTKLDMGRVTVSLLHPDAFDKGGNVVVTPEKFDKITRSAPVQAISAMAITGNGLVGGQMDGMSGTAYGWLNAVTQYVDHDARAHTDENRFQSAQFGKGADIKTTARGMALAHAGGNVMVEYAPEPISPPAGPASGGDDSFAGLLARPLQLA